jgi:hypothetical protein
VRGGTHGDAGGRKPRDDENAAEEWRAYLDIDDDLPVFCPECAERGFSDQQAGA